VRHGFRVIQRKPRRLIPIIHEGFASIWEEAISPQEARKKGARVALTSPVFVSMSISSSLRLNPLGHIACPTVICWKFSPRRAAQMLPSVTDMFIQWRKVLSFAASNPICINLLYHSEDLAKTHLIQALSHWRSSHIVSRKNSASQSRKLRAAIQTKRRKCDTDSVLQTAW
jgi:hypothetical protein